MINREIRIRTLSELYTLLQHHLEPIHHSHIDFDIIQAIKENQPLPCIVFQRNISSNEIRILSGEYTLKTAFSYITTYFPAEMYKILTYRFATQEVEEDLDDVQVKKIMALEDKSYPTDLN